MRPALRAADTIASALQRQHTLASMKYSLNKNVLTLDYECIGYTVFSSM